MRTLAGDLHTKPPSLFWRLARQVRPCWPHLTGLFALSLLAPPLALLTPLPLKIVFHSVLDTHPLPRFLRAVAPAALTASAGPLLFLALGLLVCAAAFSHRPEFATRSV